MGVEDTAKKDILQPRNPHAGPGEQGSFWLQLPRLLTFSSGTKTFENVMKAMAVLSRKKAF